MALLEVLPQRLHWRAPAYVGRSDLETLLASDRAADWVRGALPSCSGLTLSCMTGDTMQVASSTPVTAKLWFGCRCGHLACNWR